MDNQLAYLLRELQPEEMPRMYPLLAQVNKSLNEPSFLAMLPNMLNSHYRCLGAFSPDGHLVGICGFWIFPRIWCGYQMDLDNFVIDEAARNAGLGTQMLAWLERLAKESDIDTMVLDSYTNSHNAHRFYTRHGYRVRGYHFIKPLKDGEMTGKAVAVISPQTESL
jgi:GNAT superfamily N-acetyltransferase